MTSLFSDPVLPLGSSQNGRYNGYERRGRNSHLSLSIAYFFRKVNDIFDFVKFINLLAFLLHIRTFHGRKCASCVGEVGESEGRLSLAIPGAVSRMASSCTPWACSPPRARTSYAKCKILPMKRANLQPFMLSGVVGSSFKESSHRGCGRTTVCFANAAICMKSQFGKNSQKVMRNGTGPGGLASFYLATDDAKSGCQ